MEEDGGTLGEEEKSEQTIIYAKWKLIINQWAPCKAKEVEMGLGISERLLSFTRHYRLQ